MGVIHSTQNSMIKKTKKIQEQKKYREQEKLFFVEGEHLIVEANLFSLFSVIFITPKYQFISGKIVSPNNEVLATIHRHLDVQVFIIDENIAQYLSKTKTPQGIFALVHMPQRKSMIELGEADKILILDGLQNPGNVGTILRTAAAFGVHTVILTENAVDLYNDKLVRASQGLLFHMEIIKMNDVQIYDFLIQFDYQVFTLEVTGQSLDSIDFNIPRKQAIVLGNEGQGIRKQFWEKIVHQQITIPMVEGAESLNVAIAAGICLHSWTKEVEKC